MQTRYEHEVATILFKDWDVRYENVSPGTPIEITLKSDGQQRPFLGYVHHIKPSKTPGTNFTEVVCIGASYVMKQASQTVYKDITADQVINKIAKKHKFVAYTVPHNRVYPQISQTGHTDWEFMVRLAKQCGYSLRTEGTELYFQPMLNEYTNFRSEAFSFHMKPANNTYGTTIYSFDPLVGDSLPFEDAFKSAISISGVDRFSSDSLAITKQRRNKKTRIKQKSEHFDRFDTSVVAPNLEVASFEAEAAESRNAFPYRATVEVVGTPELKVDSPVYLGGLGETYSGYWTVLSVEHKIIETDLRRQTFTTIMTVGTDSLGEADKWNDNLKILSPEASPSRTIIANVRQTKRKPSSTLLNKNASITPQLTPSFGTLNNRPQTTIKNKPVDAPVWKTTSPSVYVQKNETRRPSFVTNRLTRSGKK
jgi:phage protein D